LANWGGWLEAAVVHAEMEIPPVSMTLAVMFEGSMTPTLRPVSSLVVEGSFGFVISASGTRETGVTSRRTSFVQTEVERSAVKRVHAWCVTSIQIGSETARTPIFHRSFFSFLFPHRWPFALQ
jgi:hypothetical protein